jgi:phosphatidylglycerophosphate synthase
LWHPLFFHQNLEVSPSWSGKAATAFQMLALAWIMLQLPHYLVSVYVAGIFTFISGAEYLIRGISQLRHNEKTH